MKKYAILVLCLLICLSLLAGCACEHTWMEADCVTSKTCSACGETEGEPLGHTWVEADCLTAKTCSTCGAVEGEPLGHTAGEWEEDPNAIDGTVYRERHCTVCKRQLTAETVPLDTMVRDGMFLFTPNEFMARLSTLTRKYAHQFTYEFVLADTGLAAFVFIDENQVVLQFFGPDAVPLTVYDLNTPSVWCVSLSEAGEEDKALWQCFLMACDPALDKNTAYRVDVALSAAFQYAAYNGEVFGYTRYNGLLYETVDLSFESPEEDFAMKMVNIYASDFEGSYEEDDQPVVIPA